MSRAFGDVGLSFRMRRFAIALDTNNSRHVEQPAFGRNTRHLHLASEDESEQKNSSLVAVRRGCPLSQVHLQVRTGTSLRLSMAVFVGPY